jgi:hypothetical protein
VKTLTAKKEMGWDDAIQKVLASADGQMHYKEIAEEIQKTGLRQKLGATPANTVNSIINRSINEDSDTPYVRTAAGYYSLKNTIAALAQATAPSVKQEETKPTGLIQSFGMYWRANEVSWKNKPKLLGQQQIGSDSVDFCDQIGVYVLYDRDRVIYVGRTTDRPIGQRLFEHTKGRMMGRWDRFSWFGLRGVNEKGELTTVDLEANTESVVIETLEAILIETLEPPQNRKRGDQFSATEYLQVQDPEISDEKTRVQAILVFPT